MSNFQIILNGYQEPERKLSTKEIYCLIDKYQATKDETIKEQLVNDNMKLVLSMTKRFYGRDSSGEDLFQVGIMGLIKAIENFNTSYGLQFSTYAVPLILGEMKRYLRDNHQIKISRSIRDLAYRALKIKDKYLTKFQREPTVNELAKELKVEPEEIVEALLSTNSVSSLQEEVKNDDGNNLKMIDSLKDDKMDAVITNQKIDLYDAINKLTPKEHQVIKQRYFDGLSQSEIAKELFISQAQVSRIEKKALNNLHNYLK
ncbi:SigB/SigF/SigG family RNA polymerase sigma factor [Thomasclavelia sp.]|uniref:SigB/SigF/SigG family RNA polymerase sigma factor n=1 Tax=Thomasclavelia sp. TaxID=3025757 RepID=UPI0025FA65C8|nr:SigB/SigF/SigG family RNA polymerase sigma factor [Thomasclavelia sp.]